jgi:CRISPR-associated protein Csm3
MKKTGYHEITGIIRLKSGTRIGGSDELLQIGGTDLTCIKHPVTLAPYLPGSSIKGKMRCELEQRLGKVGDGGKPCGCKKHDCLVCRVFGPHATPQHDLGPTRIVVRDAQPHGEVQSPEKKSSTAIDRSSGTALRGSLRSEERVPAGSEFTLRIGIQVWDEDAKVSYEDRAKQKHQGENGIVEFVKDGLRALQQTGLGSGISKGSGEIEFRDLKLDGTPFTL